MVGRWVALVLVSATVLVLGIGCSNKPDQPTVVSPKPGAPEATGTATPGLTALSDISITLESIATDLDQPLYVTGAGDGSGRLFVVEKSGRIWVFKNGKRGNTPLLDIANQVSGGSEQGLLGLAFPPDFKQSGFCVVDYTDLNGTSKISRFEVKGDVADANSERVLLSQAQPFANHNGGMLAFGPDGYLYIGFGDGGSAGDPQGNGQKLSTLLAKILRIDVTSPVPTGSKEAYVIPPDNPFVGRQDARGEIWAYGLRNPWRFSFDRRSGDLWIGDVGQDAWEEIDFQPASAKGGENYGWSLYEGDHTYPAGQVATKDPKFVWPVVEYDHKTGQSVTGGYVYRGSEQKALWGTYLYADFEQGRIWGLQQAADGSVETRLLLDNNMLISSFGEDDRGELYLTDLNGGLYRVVAK